MAQNVLTLSAGGIVTEAANAAAAVDQTMYIGLTGVAINRASAALNLNLGTGTLSAKNGTFSDMTSGRVALVSTSGLLADSSSYTWTAAALSVPALVVYGAVAGVSSACKLQVSQATGAGEWTMAVQSDTTSGSSYGFRINAGTTSADYALWVRNAGNTATLLDLRGNGNIGFNGTTAIAKPTITGSRAGNAALASLLTALASYGLITDSTTA